MPRKSEWLEALPGALERLAGFPAPILDRAAVERLLGVSRRTAIRLLHRWGGYQAGKTFLISRHDFELQLRALAENEEVGIEQRRRQRLADFLERSRRELPGRHISIPAAPDLRDRCLGDLPPAIRLNPGELRIRFESTEELLGYLLELSHAALNDLEGFRRTVEGHPQAFQAG